MISYRLGTTISPKLVIKLPENGLRRGISRVPAVLRLDSRVCNCCSWVVFTHLQADLLDLYGEVISAILLQMSWLNKI